jgi:YndJ-like protein
VRRNAIFGALVWCVIFLAASINAIDLTWIELLFLFAPLVIVPLGLYLTERSESGVRISGPERLARKIQAPAALLALLSFFCAPGILAGALAAAWFLFCALLALGGLLRLVRGSYARLDLLCPTASFLYALVGGAWLVASRLRLNPIGFQEPIVLLTAIHFHYAGFAAPLLARSAGRTLAARSTGFSGPVLFRILSLGVLLGPCTLAMGFVVGPRVKLLAALILTASEIGLAISFVFLLNRIRRFGAEVFITIAATSIAFSMALAIVWAIGEYPLQQFVNLDQMERFHGAANAFGFTLCGLLGWILAESSRTPDEGSLQ